MFAELPSDTVAIRPPITGHHRELPQASSSFEDEVDRLAGALSQEAQPLHLVGYSMGARLALGLLVDHRRLFESVTLIGVHPGLPTAAERRERRAADEKLARRLEEQGVERFVDQWQSLPLFQTQAALPLTVLERQRRQRLEHSAVGLAHALRVLSLGGMPNFRPDLPQLDLPVRLMVGERDGKFRRLAEEMSEALPKATIDVVPDAGHNLLLEAPQAVAERMLKNLS